MRIDKGQCIAGFPADKIRELMRETLGRAITTRSVSEALGCSHDDAPGVLAELERQGWVWRVRDHLEPSLKGSALAQATAAKALRRSTAERVVAELIARARALNEQKEFAYRLKELVLFGSYLNGSERVNDVDVLYGWIRAGRAMRRGKRSSADAKRVAATSALCRTGRYGQSSKYCRR